MKIKHFSSTALIAVLFTTLNGCGGGGSEGTSNIPNDKQPYTLSANDLSRASLLSDKLSLETDIEVDSDSITLHFNNIPDDTTTPYNFQIFLNVDNDASTGFQFDNYAWNDAGVDYLIENGSLYKSTSDQWSWEYVDVSTNYTATSPTSKSITLQKSWLEELSNKLHVGMVFRDDSWNATDFYPVSTKMADFEINDVVIPIDTEAPVLTLRGPKIVEVEQFNQYSEVITGATAVDNVDGKISHKITSTSTGDASVIGMYEIIYSVSDNAGNSSSITRIVNVVENTQKSIVIDGLVNDWSFIPKITTNSNGNIAVSNDGMMLNFFIKANDIDDNTQIFIDTDNDSSTGIQFWGSEWKVGGADYMVENGVLNRSINSDTWSWDSNIGRIDYIKNGDILEFAIPLSLLTNLSDTVNIGFISRDENWNIKYLLPADGLASYTLSSHDVTLPNDIKLGLCDNNTIGQHLPNTTGSLEQGVLFQGDTYITKTGTNGYELFKNNIKLDADFKGSKPILASTNGALYVYRTGFYDKTAMRVHGNEVIDNIADDGKYTSIKSISYVNGIDIYIKQGGYPFIPYITLTLRKPDGTQKTLIRREADSYSDIAFNTLYRDNKLFYSFNIGTNSNDSDRVIGVVSDSSGTIKILTTCN